jgi:hypothetical protein
MCFKSVADRVVAGFVCIAVLSATDISNHRFVLISKFQVKTEVLVPVPFVETGVESKSLANVSNPTI